MGRFDKDLKFILTMLSAGMDPMTGIGMYQDALGAKRERADEREQDREYLMRDVMPTLQEGVDWEEARATLNSLGESYGMGENALKDVKGTVLDDFYGGERSAENIYAQPEEGADLGWDASDEDIVLKEVEHAAKAGYGRAEIRERLAAQMRQNAERMGADEQTLATYMPMLHQAIDRAYRPYEEAAMPGHAIAENDTWLTKYDGGLASLSGGGTPPPAPPTPSQMPPTPADLDLNPRQYQGMTPADQATAASVMTAPDSGLPDIMGLLGQGAKSAFSAIPGLGALSSIWDF